MNDKRRPYIRPMAGWWHKNPFFVRYMIREATALVVAAYALFLLVGLVSFSRGEASYDVWLQSLQSPLAYGLNLLALLGMVYHAWSWFDIMPKTLPPIIINGKPLSAALITGSGITAAVVAAVVIFFVVWSLNL